jgi:hypothetical protein
VNAGVSVLTLLTSASIAGGPQVSHGAFVDADGSVRVAANDSTDLDVIVGNLSVSGSASVGAAAAVPVVNKTTEAFVGQNAIVNARGNGTGLSAATGAFTVTITDTRFQPSAVNTATDTVTLPYAHDLEDGDQVVYYAGGGAPIGGLTDRGVYYVDVVSPTQVRLQTLLKPIGLGPAKSGTQTITKVDGAIVREFNAATGISGNSITFTTAHGFSRGDKVTYDSGAAANPSLVGLTEGREYFVIVIDDDTIQLALAPQDTHASTINLTSGGTGRSQRLVSTTVASSPGGSQQFFNAADATVVNVGTDRITLPYTPEDKDGNSDPFVNGDGVKYFVSDGTPIEGLTDGATYYVVDVSGSSFKLSAEKNGTAINLTGLGTGTDHSIVHEGQTPTASGKQLFGIRTVSTDSGTVNGLAVTATNRDDYATIGFSGAFGSVGVAIGGAVNVADIVTRAFIASDARIDATRLVRK